MEYPKPSEVKYLFLLYFEIMCEVYNASNELENNNNASVTWWKRLTLQGRGHENNWYRGEDSRTADLGPSGEQNNDYCQELEALEFP